MINIKRAKQEFSPFYIKKLRESYSSFVENPIIKKVRFFIIKLIYNYIKLKIK